MYPPPTHASPLPPARTPSNTGDTSTLALKRLDANWCTKLPDSAVESLVATCLSLEHLGLKGCSALVFPSLSSANLKSLDLSLCGKLVSVEIDPLST